MLKEALEKIWKISPSLFRRSVVRITQNTFTVSVGAIVTNDEGKVLLLDHVLRPGSGWGIPGGFINENEQPEEAVRREICEEIGLEIDSIELLQVHTINSHVEVLVRAHSRGKGEVKNFEIKEVGWFTLDEMPEEMSPSHKRMIKRFLEAEGIKVSN